MSDEKRWDTSPQQHIRDLFAKTVDGKLRITDYSDWQNACDITYPVAWTAEDAETLSDRCEKLVATLHKLAELGDRLDDHETRDSLLSPEERSVWETYVRPFDPFEVDLSVVGQLYVRGEYDELDDEENALLDRHHEWFEQQSLTRLPLIHRSPRYVMNRAQRYVHLVRIGAPRTVIEEEARCLAEELVLYDHHV